MNPQDIKLIRKDILIRETDRMKVKYNSIIDVIESDDKQQSMQFHEVVGVSADTTIIRIGDIIALELGKHTIPFDVNGVMYAVTSEDDVPAIIVNIKD